MPSLEYMAAVILLHCPLERFVMADMLVNVPRDQLPNDNVHLLLAALIGAGQAELYPPSNALGYSRVWEVWIGPSGPRMPVRDFNDQVTAWGRGTGPRPPYVPEGVGE